MKNKKAFSLIEVVIASGIIAMVSGAAVALSSATLRGSGDLADRTTAIYLGVEGLELVQHIRDSNYVDEDPSTVWDKGIDLPALSGGAGYGIKYDSLTGKASLHPSAASQNITINNITYQRKIRLHNPFVVASGPSGQLGRQIIVVVTWGNGKKVEYSTILTDSKAPL